jgi:CHASE3 domain sensor protein
MKLNASFRKYPLIYPAILVMVLITINTAIVYYNNWVLKKTNAEKEECEKVLLTVTNIWDEIVRNVDIANRGFALGKTEGLLNPMHDALAKKPVFIANLRQITAKQGFTETIAIDSIDMAVDDFIAATKKMIALVRNDDMEGFMRELNADPGRNAWYIFSRNSTKINTFEETLRKQAIASYENANFRTVIFQSVLWIFALPTLLFMIFRIVRDAKSRSNLFQKLDKNNRSYMFDPGNNTEVLHEDQVIDNSIKNFKTATTFIREVSGGNFHVRWEGITPQNESLNKDNLAGELHRMRDRMMEIKQQDDIRNWVSEGLAKFSEILRKDQENIESLSYNSLVFITKYMKAQQGALFVLRDDAEGNKFLEMSACYAFNRKKHISKKVEIGQGLIGQAYLEGRSSMMTEIPNGYTQITSGLGESTPSCILIVPFKSNDKIEAVIELAGFKKFEPHEMDFMEKIGEIVAATLGSVRNTETMQTLLNQFKTTTEQLKAQEEELRQNMEEMEATQEALRRQDKKADRLEKTF